MIRLWVALFCLATISSCGGSSDLSDAITATAYETIQPAYESNLDAIATLNKSSVDACSTRSDAMLEVARDSWRTAQSVWKQSAAVWFGPTSADRVARRIGYEPVSAEGIESVIASDVVVDTTYILEASPITHIGIGAAEYLLFSDVPFDDRRCEYLLSVTEAAEFEAAELVHSWTVSWDEGPSHISRFVGEEPGALSSSEALSEVVAAIIERLKHLTLYELGPELGITTPEPEPGAFPEGNALFGLGSLQGQIEGIADVYGSGSESVSGLIEDRESSIDSQIRSDLAAAEAIIDKLNATQRSPSMVDAVATAPETMEILYGHLASLRRTFETDVVSILDLTLEFIQGDGDSG